MSCLSCLKAYCIKATRSRVHNVVVEEILQTEVAIPHFQTVHGHVYAWALFREDDGVFRRTKSNKNALRYAQASIWSGSIYLKHIKIDKHWLSFNVTIPAFSILTQKTLAVNTIHKNQKGRKHGNTPNTIAEGFYLI